MDAKNRKTPAFLITKEKYDAILFDLDGVITKTAKTHAAAWKALFDEYLKECADRSGEPFRPFDAEKDYLQYVDGKPRYEGVKSFLESRGIHLPFGTPADTTDKETVCGLGNRKNRLLVEQLKKHRVEVFDSSIELIRELQSKGFRTAVVSSSKNCAEVLKSAGFPALFSTKVDGNDAERLGLEGKPAPGTFLEAARQLGVDPARAIVVEDAIVGVQAGRRGNFGGVIGVDRTGQAAALQANGADVVVSDLSEVACEQ